MKILSIDDSKAVHSFIKECLSEEVYQLDHAYNGKEGVEKLLGAKKSVYDLILLDWEMPELNGPEVLGRIRIQELKTPIIMLTSKNDPSEIIKALELGAQEFVMKPFTKEILITKIESVLLAARIET